MDSTKELKLDYPCTWQYKAILEAQHNINVIIKEILDERDHNIRKSKNSKQGKYESYTLSVLVHSDDDRKIIFETLKQHKSIKFVL